MRGAMARRKKILHVVLGLVIGACISHLAKQGGDVCEVVENRPHVIDPLELIGEEPEQNTREKLLFVGVMTAEKYLETRAKAVYETWGNTVPGKIAFFSSEVSRTQSVPLVSLVGVDDSYPPQKKSFTMLKYMHDNYLDRFEWFMRADDDVYVRTDKLEALLRSVDSRKPWFIGQTGRGNSEEFGLLSLESDENFCMGGPGIILSRETLRRVGPHIEECLENLYTTHEDVELGRCVRKTAGVSCTWSYEASDYTSQMQVILYHNQSGEASFTGDLKQKEVHRAITLHPIKKPQYMYRLDKYVKGLTIQSNKQESIRLHRDIAISMSELGTRLESLHKAELVEDVRLFEEPLGSDLYLGDPNLLGIPNQLNRFKPDILENVLDWEFISKSIFSYKDFNPHRRLGSSMKEGLEDVVREVMEIINLYSKQRGRVIDFKEIFYGYWRLDPIHGVDLILDLLLVYRKYRGHKMTVPVRRHAYIQQTFTGIELREIDTNPEFFDGTHIPLHQQFINQVIPKLGQYIPIFTSSAVQQKKRINFILPLSGRYETFIRFMKNYEDLCILESDNTKLIVIVYKNEEIYEEYMKTREYLTKIMDRHKNSDIEIEVIDGVFSRGKALQHGVNLARNDDLLFFVDVDVVFNKNSLTRIRQNTLRNKTVYFPIVYSLYNPKLLNMSYDNSDYSAFTSERIEPEVGSWRQFGFGLVSLYKEDYINLGGINVTISGWGFEDVNFYDHVVKSDLKIVRSVDSGLVHVYHPVVCDSNLDPVQMNMCRGSQASTFGSLRLVQDLFKKYKYLLLGS